MWLALTPLSLLSKENTASGPIRSAKSGPWSAGSTWEGGRVPTAGAKVLVRPGHTVVYDVQSDQALRSVFLGGVLTFAPDRNTRLDVGLLKVQGGESCTENGFDCEAPPRVPAPERPRPALLVGTPEKPIGPPHTALIRLVSFKGMPGDSCPAIICCGGRMDFHGAPLSRSWVKLGAPARQGDTCITLAEAVRGWRVGDRILLTATTRQNKRKKTFRPSVRDSSQSEERLLVALSGTRLTLDRPLTYDHVARGVYRGEVANLSRNVVVESADPAVRGHTMYHRHSTGAISYAEFRHLGKEGVLGRYALHYHLCGDSMRGSSVIWRSIWDSRNRWLTIHGTSYLVVRDCVGYKSIGHGFFLEDGTETYNVLDRNLAVGAFSASRCPIRCCRSTTMTAPASGGPTASTASRATWPPTATSTAISSRHRRRRALIPPSRFSSPTAAASAWTCARCRSCVSRTTKPIVSAATP